MIGDDAHQSPTNPAAPVTIRLFGPFELTTAEGESIRLSGKALALFAYLLLYGQQSRVALTEALWSSTPSERRGSRLSDTIYRLRRALAGRFLLSDENLLCLDFAGEPWVDVWQFNELAQGSNAASLRQAVALYRGDLLPESDEEWLLSQRIALQDTLFSCLLALGEEAEDKRDLAAAAGYYRQLISRNPLFEAGYRGLMRALAGSGQIARALETYAELEALLAAELAIAPAGETSQLAETLSRELETSHIAPPFVGRRQERARLLRALERAGDGQGGLVVLLGESGIGKSRLLAELERAANWRRWRVQWGRGEDMALPPPYAPLAEALRQALPAARQQQLAQQLPAATLAAASPLLAPVAESQAATLEKRHLAPALVRILEALGELLPHLFLLDDVQWADPEIWPLLITLQRELSRASVLIVLAGRIDELQAQPEAWATIGEWDAAGVPIIRLEGLSTAELAELSVGRLAETAVEQLQQASGGNPLIALTLLAEQTQLENESVVAIENVLRQRVGRLSDPAGRALQLAATLGAQFPYDTWSDLQMIVPDTAFPEVASELERAGLLHLEEQGYRFAHDTLRTLVYSDTPADRRRHLHEQVLQKLLASPQPDPLVLLHHARQAEAEEQMGPIALTAGNLMLRHLSYRNAVAHFTLALEKLPDSALEARYEALTGRIKALTILGHREEHGADTAALLAVAEQIDRPKQLANAFQLQAHYLWLAGDQKEASDAAEKGLALAKAHGDTACEADLEQILARVARNLGDFSATLAHMTRAHELYKSVGDTLGAAQTLDKMANLAYEAGDYPLAIARHQTAAQQFAEMGETLHEARTLNGLALAIRAQGDIAGGLAIHEKLVATGKELGDRELIWVQQTNLGNIAFEMGDFDTAISWYTTTIELLREMDYPYGLGLVLTNLGEAKLQLEQYAAARSHYEEALTVNEAHGYQRGVANAYEGIGLCWAGEGQYAKALPQLHSAYDLWVEFDQKRKLVYTAAVLAQAHLALGDLDAAQKLVAESLALIDIVAATTVKWRTIHFAAYQVNLAAGEAEAALNQLALAAAALEQVASELTPAEQERLNSSSSLNRQIVAAARATATQQTVQLARQDAPRGRALNPDELCQVTWTISAVTDTLISNSAARRQAIIKRLLKEAATQGAAPTDADLAAALGVSRRTIIRDMAALQAAGDLSTRGR